MAYVTPPTTTKETFTANGTGIYSFSIEYKDQADIQVLILGNNGFVVTPQNDVTNPWIFASLTQVQFTNGDPGSTIRIQRNTDINNIDATFALGSAIRAQDLNDNFSQLLFTTQEILQSDAIGPEGPQGIQGPEGPEGPQGVAGEDGKDGIDLTPGIYDPNSPPVCDTAGQGMIDAAGNIWVCDGNGTWVNSGPVQGPQGQQGIQGVKGDQGNQGDAGPKGEAGAPGIQGIQGPAGAQGIQGIQGDKGDKGDGGTAATVAVDTTTTVEYPANAQVNNVGNTTNAVLQFIIPRGQAGLQGPPGADGTSIQVKGAVATFTDLPTNAQEGDLWIVQDEAGEGYVWTGAEWLDVGPIRGPEGEKGDAATITVGTTTTGTEGTNASVTNSGTASAAEFNFTIPRGDKGIDGVAATVDVGTTTTLPAGFANLVTNVGSTSAAIFDFDLAAGDKGDPGTPATVTVGTTTTGNAGTNAQVTNSGTASAAILDFTIPKGDEGEKGDQGNPGTDGAAATVTVGTTTTGAAGTSAQVTNSGTTSAAEFNFTIPRGDKGDKGDPGVSPTGPYVLLDWSTYTLLP